MRYGTLDGKIDGIWQVAYDSGVLTGAATSLTISGLNGDVDKEYELYSFVKNAYNGGASFRIVLNSDTGNNYGTQDMYAANTGTSAYRGVQAFLGRIASVGAQNEIGFAVNKIIAKSGYVRTGVGLTALQISGTTVTAIESQGQSWNNTADNLTTISIVSNQASSIGAGSRFILLKKVDASSGMRTGILQPNEIKGCWKRVYDNTLTEAATSVTVSGLTGNTTPILRVRARSVSGYNGSSDGYLRINNDSTANKYGMQRIYGAASSVSAFRGTIDYLARVFSTSANNRISLSEHTIFSPTGNIRTALSSITSDITGTTVASIENWGSSYNETSTEITSLDFVASVANGFAAGTHIEVDALII